jgi:hypothetical protein
MLGHPPKQSIQLIIGEHHTEMPHAPLPVGQHLLWLLLQRDLHPEEPDIEPSVPHSTQLTAKCIYIEPPRFLKIRHRKGDMQDRFHRHRGYFTTAQRTRP